MKKSKIKPNKVRQTLARHTLADGMDLVIDFERSKGSKIFDAKRGRYFLDLMSFHASLPLGFNHPYLTSQKSKAEIMKVALHKPSNPDVYSVEYAEFVDTFARVAKPKFMKYVFFIEGGALAVENALKAAFDWKVRKNLAQGRGERGQLAIHFQQAFHGRSGYTVSMTNTADPKKYLYFPKFDWPRIVNPKITFPLNKANLSRVKKLERQALQQINSILKKKKLDVACIVIEPIQGEGGDNHFRREFHQALRDICDKEDILLIYDEVQTGMGLTGKMWAYEHYGVKPDLIAFGKKIQVGGFMASGRLDQVKDHVFKLSSRISSTWGGSLVDMVRGKLILEAYEKEKILKHVQKMSRLLMRDLEKLQKDFPQKISNVRGVGLMVAFDLKDKKTRDTFIKKLFDRGVLILASGERSVRFRPTLTITEEELSTALRTIKATLKEI